MTVFLEKLLIVNLFLDNSSSLLKIGHESLLTLPVVLDIHGKEIVWI
jgi:hypothetical protein